MRGDPRDIDIADTCLEVIAFDGGEDTGEGASICNEVAKFAKKALAVCDALGGNTEGVVDGQVGEKGDDAKRVIQVTQGVVEAGVALDNKVVKAGARGVKRETLKDVETTLGTSLNNLLLVGVLMAEGDNQTLVSEKVDVLAKIIGLVGALKLLAGVAGVHPLENAEAAKLRYGELELLEGLCSGDEGLGVPRGPALLLASHVAEERGVGRE